MFLPIFYGKTQHRTDAILDCVAVSMIRMQERHRSAAPVRLSANAAIRGLRRQLLWRFATWVAPFSCAVMGWVGVKKAGEGHNLSGFRF